MIFFMFRDFRDTFIVAHVVFCICLSSDSVHTAPANVPKPPNEVDITVTWQDMEKLKPNGKFYHMRPLCDYNKSRPLHPRGGRRGGGGR